MIGAENVGLEHGDEFRAGDVLEEIRFRALAGGRGVAVVSCSNTAMTYDDFAAGFAPGALAAFKVEPSSGVLNGARGEPTEFKASGGRRGAAPRLGGGGVGPWVPARPCAARSPPHNSRAHVMGVARACASA